MTKYREPVPGPQPWAVDPEFVWITCSCGVDLCISADEYKRCSCGLKYSATITVLVYKHERIADE